MTFRQNVFGEEGGEVVRQESLSQWSAKNQLRLKSCADLLQRGGAIRGAIVNNEFAAAAAFENGLFENAFDLQLGFGEAKGAVHDEPRDGCRCRGFRGYRMDIDIKHTFV